MKRFTLAILRGMLVLIITRVITQYIFEDILRHPAYSLGTVFVKDCLSIAAGALVAGYSNRERGWLVGLLLACFLCVGLVVLWTYLSEFPLTHVLYGILRHPTTLLQFPVFLALGTLVGMGGSMLRNRIGRPQPQPLP